MLTVVLALSSFALYIIAYRTYGRYLARRIFRIDPARPAPSVELNDGVDYVPSDRRLVFGHHFTSIAGTGPIVGPAIAVIWGWAPALLWVVLGSILMGAVHDFGSLVISMRHRGRTIGDLARDVVNARVRLLFLAVVLLGLWIVLAVFGLVIATIFREYPSAILPVFLQTPIAIALGLSIRRGGSLLLGSILAVGAMYAIIALSAAFPQTHIVLPASWAAYISPAAFWTIVLLVYVYIASVLPVQWLLQPRDYINSHQLMVAMALLLGGVLWMHPPIVGDALNVSPRGAPPFMPFLFITIACGAISGFHCLVASGCSSRQLRSEGDAQYVGYGAMLTEGFLAVLIILAAVAGIGLGTAGGEGAVLTGHAAWQHHYSAWGDDKPLASKLAPVVVGAANMIEGLRVPHAFALTLMGVFIASFAATTMDSAARLQRYVIAEFGAGLRPRVLFRGRHGPTMIAVASAAVLALSDAFGADPLTGEMRVNLAAAGAGGLLLWPIFGAVNQLLGGLALLVITVWLVRTRRPIWVTALPMAFMLAMTGWAMAQLIVDDEFGFRRPGQAHLLAVAAVVLGLEVWIVAEAALLVMRPARRREAPGLSPLA